MVHEPLSGNIAVLTVLPLCTTSHFFLKLFNTRIFPIFLTNLWVTDEGTFSPCDLQEAGWGEHGVSRNQSWKGPSPGLKLAAGERNAAAKAFWGAGPARRSRLLPMCAWSATLLPHLL